MSNTNHAIIRSSGNLTPQEHCELPAQPLAHPGRRTGLFLSTSLSCPLSPALRVSQPDARQLPPLPAASLDRLQGHNDTQTLFWADQVTICASGGATVSPHVPRELAGQGSVIPAVPGRREALALFSHRLPHPWAPLCTCHSYHALK